MPTSARPSAQSPARVRSRSSPAMPRTWRPLLIPPPSRSCRPDRPALRPRDRLVRHRNERIQPPVHDPLELLGAYRKQAVLVARVGFHHATDAPGRAGQLEDALDAMAANGAKLVQDVDGGERHGAV